MGDITDSVARQRLADSVLFCGINPSLYSAAVGHHFARPGNRFWPALHAAGFTDRVLSSRGAGPPRDHKAGTIQDKTAVTPGRAGAVLSGNVGVLAHWR